MTWRVAGLAALLFAAPAFAQDERPSGAPTSANERPASPVSLSLVYTADLRGNVRGGIATGARYLDNVDLQLSVDADRLVGWKGARLFVYGLYNNGTPLSTALVGDVQSVSNVETDVRALRLFEAWVEQDIGQRASLKFGLYNLNSEFDTTRSGGLFLLSSHGIGPDFSRSGRNGPSIFPVTSLALRGEVKFGSNWLARVAVLDGVPGDPDHPARTAIKLSGRDGALLVGELDYLRGGTKLAMGGWGYTARFDDVAATPATATGRGNKGAYVIAEHRFSGERDDAPKGLSGWLRFGVADPRYNMIASYLGGGLVYAGPFPGRAEDEAGIALASANFSRRYREFQLLAGNPTDRRELVVEASYRAAIADWLSLQPDLQYVANPGGDARRRDAVVLGLRVKIGK